MIFYLLVASLLIAASKCKSKWRAWLNLRTGAWLSLAACLVALVTRTRFCLGGCGYLEGAFHVSNLGGFAPYFVLGAVISKLGRQRLDLNLKWLLIVSSVMATWQVFIRLGATSPNPNWPLGLACLLGAIGLMVLGQFRRLEVGERRALTLGHIALLTYPIYLFHESFGLSVISLEVQAGVDSVIAYASTLLLVLVFSEIVVRKVDPLVSSWVRAYLHK